MDNYLSHRWPKGAGVQPPPVPAGGSRGRRQKPTRKPRRWVRPLVITVCVVLSLALLCGASFWSMSNLAAYLDGLEFSYGSDDFVPLPSRHIPHSSDWTADDLPWGDPAPSVQLSLASNQEDVLSGPDIYERILPSIVYIEANTAEGAYSGAGVIVTQSGYVITNYHIIEESTRIQITPLADQSHTYDAQVIGFDDEFDLAMLKFSASGLVPAPLGDSDALRVGETVYAIGNPIGCDGSMTDGIVSALNRDTDGDSIGYIQTSAALNPGNSGGALVNNRGQVVGITSAKITGLIIDDETLSWEDAAVIEAIGLARPITDVLPFVNHILSTGKSCRPAIGVTCAQTRQYNRDGILIRSVEEDVPARQAGLAEGDFIIEANGQPISTLTELRHVLYRTGVGGEVTCTILRDSEELDITFSLIDSLEN